MNSIWRKSGQMLALLDAQQARWSPAFQLKGTRHCGVRSDRASGSHDGRVGPPSA